MGLEARERERVDGVGALDALDPRPHTLNHTPSLPWDTLSRYRPILENGSDQLVVTLYTL